MAASPYPQLFAQAPPMVVAPTPQVAAQEPRREDLIKLLLTELSRAKWIDGIAIQIWNQNFDNKLNL